MGKKRFNPATIDNNWALSDDWQLSVTIQSKSNRSKVRNTKYGQVSMASLSYTAKGVWRDETDLVFLTSENVPLRTFP